MKKSKSKPKSKSVAAVAATSSATARTIVYPEHLPARYERSIDRVTIWRWLRDGKLPALDVFVGGRFAAWKAATLDSWDSIKPVSK